MNYELIARMLETGGGTYTQAAIDEQIAALREADNAHEARTVCREQQPAGDGPAPELQRILDDARAAGYMVDTAVPLDVLQSAIAALTAAGRGGEVVAWQYQLHGEWYTAVSDEPWRSKGMPVRPLYAATPQQPPPVGVTDAIDVNWLFDLVRDAESGLRKLRVRGDDYSLGHETRSVALRLEAGDFTRARRMLNGTLFHQQAAPSVSDQHCGACGFTKSGLPDCPNCLNDGCACDTCNPYPPVSEPVASESECTCSDMQAAHGHHFGCPVLHTPDAASVEGLEELLDYAVRAARRREQAGDRGQFTLSLDTLEAIARRLTTTGQGDVERLVEAARAFEATFWKAVNLTDSRDFDHDVCKEVRDFRAALAPFGQQQEGQG